MSQIKASRDDSTSAESIMVSLCPDAKERHRLLQQLLESCAVAERVAPRACSVTLFKDGSGFRLNVGNVEAMAYRSGLISLLLHGDAPTLMVGHVSATSYSSVPQPQSSFECSTKDFLDVGPLVQVPHAAFVRAAAVTVEGKPRKANFARFHSFGLIAYAQRVAGQ